MMLRIRYSNFYTVGLLIVATFLFENYVCSPLNSRSKTTSTTTTTNDEKSISTQHRIGCLLSVNICTIDEQCFDDNLFGRCVSEADVNSMSDSVQYDPAIDRQTLKLVERELERLADSGASWSDDYTQCRLQYILNNRPIPSLFDESYFGDVCGEFRLSNDALEKLAAEQGAYQGRNSIQSIQASPKHLVQVQTPNNVELDSEPEDVQRSRGEEDAEDEPKKDSDFGIFQLDDQSGTQKLGRLFRQQESGPYSISSDDDDIQRQQPQASQPSAPLFVLRNIKSQRTPLRTDFDGVKSSPRREQQRQQQLRELITWMPTQASASSSNKKKREEVRKRKSSDSFQSNISPVYDSDGVLLAYKVPTWKNAGENSFEPVEQQSQYTQNAPQHHHKSNNVDNSDDPLRKYKNRRPTTATSKSSGQQQHRYNTFLEPTQFRQQNRQLKSDEQQQQEKQRLSQLPVLLIRNRNLPLVLPELVRGARSANFYEPPEEEIYNQHEPDTITLLGGDDDGTDDNDDDSTIVVIDDSEEPEVQNNDNSDDYDELVKEFKQLLDRHENIAQDDEIPDETGTLFIVDLEDDDNSQNGQESPAHDEEDSQANVYGIVKEIDEKATRKQIQQDHDDGYEDREEKEQEQPEMEDDGESLSLSETGEQQAPKETIYGTINYNNNNDEDVRRLSNFYRKHRYDIKKPGPMFLEKYFFDDTEPTEIESSNIEQNDDESNDNSWIINEANMKLTQNDVNEELPETNLENEKQLKNEQKSQPEMKIITENPDIEPSIRSSFPLSEGPVKVDAKFRNTLIIRRAEDGEPTNLEAIDSTHTYVVVDRVVTVDGSKVFMKTVEQVLRLPRGTLSNLRLDREQITFKVNPNYRNLNASTVAGKIEENANLLKDITGYNVKESGIGNRAKLPVVSELLFKRENQRLIHYTLLVCSIILASLSAAGVIMFFRKNLKFREKVRGVLKNTEDYMKFDYSDLLRQRVKRDTPKEPKKNGEKSPKIDTTQAAKQECEKQVVSPSSRSSTSSWSEEPVTSNMDIATGHLVLTYMEGHLKKKDRLDKEWEALCGYEVEPSSTNAASQAQNASKNRDPEVLPYDHSRVILNDLVNSTKSDYINANSITDSDPRHPAYIATQGPLSSTKADFWQMVWEQGSVIIVMLTRLRESGLSVCDRYWPEEGAETYQDYEVHLVSEHIWCDDYLVRSFYLKNLKTGETRTVTQFHFLSWPANGLPPSTKALLDFRRKVNKSYKGRSCPVIVHCSDGIGRTGTFILIDMVLNRLSKGAKEIDIAASLEHLRDQRIGMVKTKQQFEFVLLAVADEVQAILKSLAQN